MRYLVQVFILREYHIEIDADDFDDSGTKAYALDPVDVVTLGNRIDDMPLQIERIGFVQKIEPQ